MLEQQLSKLASKDSGAMTELLGLGPQFVPQAKDLRNTLDEIVVMHAKLKGDKKDEAIKSIDYFLKYRASKYIAVALFSSIPDVSIHATKRLAELRDKSVLPDVIRALEKNNRLVIGSEVATLHQNQVVQLVGLINLLTGESFNVKNTDDTQAIKTIVEKAKSHVK